MRKECMQQQLQSAGQEYHQLMHEKTEMTKKMDVIQKEHVLEGEDKNDQDDGLDSTGA